MPKPFHSLTVEQFAELLGSFPFSRNIDSIHLHHTWRPNHSQYRGLTTLEAMFNVHTQENSWSDIAQHVSIAPDGTIWTGRNWNAPPASARGFNGNGHVGPFMIEMIGDFDRGKDVLEREQRQAVLAVIARVQQRFDLSPESLRFHNALSDKSCPGSAIEEKGFREEVATVRGQLPDAVSNGPRATNFPFDNRVHPVTRIIDDLRAVTPSSAGDGDGEGCNRSHQLDAQYSRETAPHPEARNSRGTKLTPEMLHRLRPHVINLNVGRLSSKGKFQTREADVDAIFEDHLVAWAQSRQEQKLPIVFYAHGGLTSEESGLITADLQVQWWKDNGVFPIHFVWETGLMETLGQILNPRRARGLDWFAPTDFAVEMLARTIGGVHIWSGMKVSAERAAGAQGGARYAARKLKEFCERSEFKDRIELHAVGHSAGSIFHTHFLRAAVKEEQVPSFRSVQFLAPAIRVDTFEERFKDLIGPGNGVDHLSIFTMARSYELDDTCSPAYRKSLLYLIYYALESERKTPILGLEESLRGNSWLKRLFDLDRRGGGHGEVIWSVSKNAGSYPASTSRTHGGFDNDAPTMESVAQRIIGRKPTRFTGTETRGLGVLEALQIEHPSLAPLLQEQGNIQAAASNAPGGSTSGSSHASSFAAAPSGSGRRRALCIGIDRYPTAPLGGCANDARQWRETFRALGFEEPQILLDEEATRDAIVRELTGLILESKAGDVVAFQFAGHGTQLRDIDGDETGANSDGLDEALCPIDFAQGRFVIDDDLAAIFDRIPDGVNVTVFTDCCHSGTITRLAIGTPSATGARSDTKARFVLATPAMQQAHAEYRRTLAGSRAPKSRGAYDQAREILFCACRAQEVALESGGHGHFTTQATRLLSSGGQGITNEAFQDRVIQGFGPSPSQNPELHCAKPLRTRQLLAPVHEAAGSRAAAAVGTTGSGREEVAQLLEKIAQTMRG